MNISQKIIATSLVGSTVAMTLAASVAFAAPIGASVTGSVGVSGRPGFVARRIFASTSVEFQGPNRPAGMMGSSTRPFPGVRVHGQASTTAGMAGQTTAADTEIANRIDALQKLGTRITSMVKVSASEKASLQTEIQNEIATLTNLQNAIASATSTAEVRAERQSITGSYRIYALVVPQTSILAAVDRVENLVTMMTTLGTKLQTRLASTTISAANQAALTDFSAKVSDAKVQAQAAQTAVVNLTPDQGNQTQLQANTAALKAAHANLQTASNDLTAARADAAAILKSLGVKVSAEASVSENSSQ